MDNYVTLYIACTMGSIIDIYGLVCYAMFPAILECIQNYNHILNMWANAMGLFRLCSRESFFLLSEKD